MTSSIKGVMLIFPLSLAVFGLFSRRAETGNGNESPFVHSDSPLLEQLMHNDKLNNI